MEKSNFDSQGYRDNLAKDLKEIRKTDPEMAQGVLAEEKNTIRYKEAGNIHTEEREKLIDERKIKLEQQEQEEVNKKIEEFKLEIEEALKNNDFNRVSQLTQSAKDTAESIEKRKEKELFIKELSDEIKGGKFEKKFIEYIGGYSMIENSDSFKRVTPKYSGERLKLSKDDISDVSFKLLIDKYSLPTYLLEGQANTNRTDQWNQVGSFLSKIGFSAQENKEVIEKVWNNLLANEHISIAVGLGRILSKYDTQDFYLNKDVIKNLTRDGKLYPEANFVDKNGKDLSREKVLKIIEDGNQDIKARVNTWFWHTSDLNRIEYQLNIEDIEK